MSYFMKFQMDGGCRKAYHLLYIPCTNSKKVGYLCLDNLGIPIGYKLLQGGSVEYWFGTKQATWICMDGRYSSVTVDCFGSTELVESARFVYVIFSVDGLPDASWTVRYDLREKFYTFSYSQNNFESYDNELYCVSASDLAKYYVMSS